MRRKTISRVEVVLVRERTAEHATPIRCAGDVLALAAAVIWPSGMPPVEEFWALLLDARNRLVGKALVSRGSVQECPVSPADVARPAILSAVPAVIVVHNHPSAVMRT
jgi:DNA repair protein RadC